MSDGSQYQQSAKVRGDEAYELAKQRFGKNDLFTALTEATQAVGFMRMYYGKNSAEVRDALDFAKKIQEQIIIQNPKMAPRRRRSKQHLLNKE